MTLGIEYSGYLFRMLVQFSRPFSQNSDQISGQQSSSFKAVFMMHIGSFQANFQAASRQLLSRFFSEYSGTITFAVGGQTLSMTSKVGGDIQINDLTDRRSGGQRHQRSKLPYTILIKYLFAFSKLVKLEPYKAILMLSM